ncbi:MAG: hypothetical protein V1775_14415 [Bacteroidota bacterium]
MKTTQISNKLMLAAAVVICLNFSSCKKYEDGPMFSLMSKTARLTGEWEIVKIDGERIDDGVSIILEFEKDGDFKSTYSYDSYSYSSEGEWEWASGKESVEITLDGEKIEFEISRLTNSEFWFEDEDNEEYQCEKK